MDGIEHRLTRFLSVWRRSSAARSQVGRLEIFVQKVSPLLPRRPSRPLVVQIDIERLRKVLPELSGAMRAARSDGGSINPWAVAGLKRREVRNAAVLAALWSPAQCGDVAIAFLVAFLRLVGGTRVSFPDETELSKGFVVRTEHCPGADYRDRVDIVIESVEHLIGVEIKINAGEGSAQLARYVSSIRRNAKSLGKSPAVILLAPFRPSHEETLPASWADVRAAAMAILPKRQADYTYAHHLVAGFARHVKTF